MRKSNRLERSEGSRAREEKPRESTEDECEAAFSKQAEPQSLHTYQPLSQQLSADSTHTRMHTHARTLMMLPRVKGTVALTTAANTDIDQIYIVLIPAWVMCT